MENYITLLIMVKGGGNLLTDEELLVSFFNLIASSSIAFNWSPESFALECKRLMALTKYGSISPSIIKI